ncbi:MAG: tryptophan--tRNA ligase [Alphaproteobacteria bacterium]|nr:tryptophan--tRNA ligase [Alphaproteobacteria bacterium]
MINSTSSPTPSPHHPRRVFSGIQPSGSLHLGNYLGAIKNWVALQDKMESIFCIVDLHAITVWQEPSALYQSTLNLAAALIAAGIDPQKHILFQQSGNPDHANLAWLFNCVARLGWLNRMTQFKDKAGKDREQASAGLFVYPNLMAADILLYHASHVPVGEDQKQHLELTRDIADKFNHDFAVPDFFPLPEPLILPISARVMSLRDGRKKMSKSDPSDLSRINLSDDNDAIDEKIKRAKTDSGVMPDDGTSLATLEETRPEVANLIGIMAGLSDRPPADIINEWAGHTFAPFKTELAAQLVATIEPIRKKMISLSDDQEYLKKLLNDGAARARRISAPLLRQTMNHMGFIG